MKLNAFIVGALLAGCCLLSSCRKDRIEFEESTTTGTTNAKPSFVGHVWENIVSEGFSEAAMAGYKVSSRIRFTSSNMAVLSVSMTRIESGIEETKDFLTVNVSYTYNPETHQMKFEIVDTVEAHEIHFSNGVTVPAPELLALDKEKEGSIMTYDAKTNTLRYKGAKSGAMIVYYPKN